MNNHFVFLQQSSLFYVIRILFFLAVCTSNAYILNLKKAIINSDIHKVQSIVFVAKLSEAEKNEMLQLAEQVYAQAQSEVDKRFWRHRKNWYAIMGGLGLFYASIPVILIARYHPFDFYNKMIIAYCDANHVYRLPDLIAAHVPDKLAFLGVAGTGSSAMYCGLCYIKAGVMNSFVKERFDHARQIRDYFL